MPTFAYRHQHLDCIWRLPLLRRHHPADAAQPERRAEHVQLQERRRRGHVATVQRHVRLSGLLGRGRLRGVGPAGQLQPPAAYRRLGRHGRGRPFNGGGAPGRGLKQKCLFWRIFLAKKSRKIDCDSFRKNSPSEKYDAFCQLIYLSCHQNFKNITKLANCKRLFTKIFANCQLIYLSCHQNFKNITKLANC